MGDRASLHHEQAELVEARRLYESALSALRELGDTRGEGLGMARLGAVLAAMGEVDAATRVFSNASDLLASIGDATSLDVVDFSRAFVDIAQDNPRRARARASGALARGPRGEPPLIERSDDARRILRILERVLRDRIAEGSARVLAVGPDGAAYRPPDGQWHDLTNRKAARLLLAALISRHRGAPLSSEDLWRAAWPNERTTGDAWLNRLHVALSYLRRNGLRAYILRRDGRYLLDPTLAIETEG
jgi:hypothetical protein